MYERFSNDWKVKPLFFPSIGKARGIISKPWETSGVYFQALENRKNQVL